jgi:hypothetical protein
MEAAVTKRIRISDVTGQKAVKAPAVPSRLAIGEFVQSLIARMGLARNDVHGRPLKFQAQLAREGRHLRNSEIVGDALRDDDEIVLTPDIDAG